MQLAELCNKKVIDIAKEETILNATKLLRNEHVGCLIVTETKDGIKTPIGIVTDRDIVLKVLDYNTNPANISVYDIMDSKFVTAKVTDDIHTALNLMQQNGIRRIPLVDDHNHLVGIVTADDMFAHFSKELNQLSSAIHMEQSREKLLQQKII